MREPAIDVRQIAAGYYDAAMWGEALAADAARVVALLTQRKCSANELQRFAENLRESAAKLRLHVAHAETALQRVKAEGEG